MIAFYWEKQQEKKECTIGRLKERGQPIEASNRKVILIKVLIKNRQTVTSFLFHYMYLQKKNPLKFVVDLDRLQ